MHEFTLFLLKNWLPVGIASIVFFLIGLLLAKFIWGRWSQRLAFAVEENLNLASQWNALGSSQRDLFKKLRARWQSDRDAWEGRIVEAEALVAQRDARIEQLTSSLNREGKEIPAEVALDAKLIAEIESLKTEIRRKEDENRELKAEAAAPVQPAALMSVTPSEGASELEARISDLEKDLIDTHDELHQVRTDYLKQVELVEVLETRLATEEESKSSAAKEGQLAALLSLKSREVLRFQDEIGALSASKHELESELAAALDNAALAEVEEGLRKELKSAQIKILDRDSDIGKLRKEVAAKEETIQEIRGEVSAKESEIESLEEKLSALDESERRRSLLQADLNDACHEMYDVRSALNHRLDEIGLLEARMDELENVEENLESSDATLKDTRHELSDVRIAYNEKVSELEQKAAEMEELEAIIEDRGAEVNDLSNELRQKRDELRLLKNSLAETEGELEALSVQAGTYTASVEAKESFLEEQARRIADLESALSERYAELNVARSELDEHSRDSKYHQNRSEQLESELARREAAFKESDERVASAEEAVEEARAQIDDLTNRLNSSEQSVQELQDSLQSLSREKDEKIRELEQATRRVGELEEATRDREEHIRSIEQEWRDGQHHSESLERQLSRLNLEMEEARENRKHTQVSIEELEEALKASDDRVLSLSNSIEEKDSELTSVRAEMEDLQRSLTRRDEEIATARSDTERMMAEISSKEQSIASSSGEESDTSLLKEQVARLTKELSEKQREIQRFSTQRGGSSEEIVELKRKIEKRGNAIRELQNEVSSIMMQRTARENEVSSLKEKLSRVEQELIKARELTANASASAMATPPSVKDLEAALQHSLESEAQKSEGRSLDQLETGETLPKEMATEAHHSTSESEDDENAVYFDETSASLKENEIQKIDEFARRIRRSNKLMVSVIGFAGAEGTADLTESLSARRADAVRERLLERGVPQARIEVRSSGQDRKFSNWRARRVELVSAPIAVAESVN